MNTKIFTLSLLIAVSSAAQVTAQSSLYQRVQKVFKKPTTQKIKLLLTASILGSIAGFLMVETEGSIKLLYDNHFDGVSSQSRSFLTTQRAQILAIKPVIPMLGALGLWALCHVSGNITPLEEENIVGGTELYTLPGSKIEQNNGRPTSCLRE
jgi:hypothetical protein